MRLTRREVNKMKMKRIGGFIGLLSVVGLLAGVLAPSVAFAATSQNVTVTGTPSFIAITNTPGTWTINGSGFMLPNTTYYSNPLGETTLPSDPVVDGECRFTVTNASSTVPLDLTVNFGHFTGGDAMQNSNSGNSGANAFGAYSYCSGMTYSSGKVIAKTTGSGLMKTNWTSSTLKWGLTIKTQSGDWTTGATQTATVTITATAD